MRIGYYTGKHIKNNVVSFLEKHATYQPDRIAFYFSRLVVPQLETLNHEFITYLDFNNRVGNVAGGFLKLGIKKNDRVVVFVPISPELYISVAALQRIGAIPVLLDSLSRQEQLAVIIKNSGPCGIIAPITWLRAFEKYLDGFGVGIRIATDENFEENNIIKLTSLFLGDTHGIIPVQQDHTALITYTTGSSGIPKGVNRTHRFLAAQHYALKRLFPYSSTDVDLPVFPVFALNNLASGITTVIPAIDISKPSPLDAKILISQISQLKVNCMTLAPSSFKNLATYCSKNGIALEGISRVLTGGAPIGETDISRFLIVAPHSKNWILYGSTEVEPIAYIESKKMLAIKASKQTNVTKIGVNVGKIDKALRYKFIDIETGNIRQIIDIRKIEINRGEVGELIVAGEHVCGGYYKNKEAFLRAKIRDASGTTWHRTGDLARLDKNGYLWIVGRMHNVIKRGNEYFFPVRPEIILKDIPDVINAAYLDLEIMGKQKIVAVVTLKNRGGDVEVSCRKTIDKIFKKEELPLDEAIFIEEIPMDVRHHSKVDYNSLRKKLYEIFA